jgi:hypothetical protein
MKSGARVSAVIALAAVACIGFVVVVVEEVALSQQPRAASACS